MSVSNCCNAPIDDDILICQDCREHAEAVCELCFEEGCEGECEGDEPLTDEDGARYRANWGR